MCWPLQSSPASKAARAARKQKMRSRSTPEQAQPMIGAMPHEVDRSCSRPRCARGKTPSASTDFGPDSALLPTLPEHVSGHFPSAPPRNMGHVNPKSGGAPCYTQLTLHMEGMEGLLTDQHTQLSLTGAHETHALPVLSVHGSIPGGNGRIMTLFASLGCPSGQQFPEVSAAVPKTAPPLVCPPVPSGISSGGPVSNYVCSV
jgi:hypothetical protein